MVYFIKRNTMGQTKKLLDAIFELDESIYPEDMELDYEIWLAQKEAEKTAYEEMLTDKN
jgi:hypothetical protein